jgi:hypothetical protein
MKIRKVIIRAFLILIAGGLLYTIIMSRHLLDLLFMTAKHYIPTEIPADTTKLFKLEGNPNSNEVFIYVQGGPNWRLDNRKLSPFKLMPQINNSLKIYAFQSQILNHSIFPAKPVLTDAQAQSEVLVSAEILYRIIDYFKKQDKRVYVICHSHGGQIALEMLRTKSNIADKLLISCVRLDIEPEAINIIKDGMVPYYENGQTLKSRYLLPSFLRIPNLNRKIENMSKLMIVANHRYTELLKDKDLSNVVYVYAKYDEMSGKQTPSELEFLRNKGVTVSEFDCGHNDLATPERLDIIFTLLKSK